ncbi:MAG: hypothetical protein DWH91_11675 [Planctomycetota bacterium]|nr:MAG: hypothetical protein DWH91_11675 [Planctomycetota bacterium]
MLARFRSHRGLILMGAALLLLLVSGLFLASALSRQGEPYLGEVALTGSPYRIRLLKTYDGPVDYSWQSSRFRSFLPSAPRVPPNIHVQLAGTDRITGQPGQTFLFRTVDDRGRYVMPMGNSVHGIVCEFVESTGFVFQVQIAMADFPHWGTYAFTRSAFPRRDRELRIRMERESPGMTPAEMLVVPNPYYRADFPEWQPAPLPTMKSNGPLKVHLEKVFADDHHRGARLELRGESAQADWQQPYFDYHFEDATGNRGLALSPFEPVWKAVVRIYRSSTSPFPDELHEVLSGVPILKPGTVQPIHRTIEMGGVQCLVRCAAGAGIVRLQGETLTARINEGGDSTPVFTGSTGQGFHELASPSPFLWIEIRQLSQHSRIVVQQVLPDGKRSECPLTSISTSDGAGSRNYVLARLENAAIPDVTEITLAVNRPETMEFQIAPPAEARERILNPPHH